VFAIDINECEHSPCGNNTICTDTIGSFVCSCKEDYTGDPMKGCQGIYFYSLSYFYLFLLLPMIMFRYQRMRNFK